MDDVMLMRAGMQILLAAVLGIPLLMVRAALAGDGGPESQPGQAGQSVSQQTSSTTLHSFSRSEVEMQQRGGDSSSTAHSSSSHRHSTTVSGDGLVTTRVSLVGSVRAGVEPGCRVLTAAGTTYLLIDGDRSLLQPGTRVRVHGTPQPGRATTCLGPNPLRVLHAEPA